MRKVVNDETIKNNLKVHVRWATAFVEYLSRILVRAGFQPRNPDRGSTASGIPVTDRILKSSGVSFSTGPDVIGKIVQAIELGQSVLLEGPRGSGKSYCIAEAVKQAGEFGVIPKGAYVHVTGSREVSANYLIEDSVAFEAADASGLKAVRRPGPLFKFARRDENDALMIDENGRLICGLGPGLEQDCNRFVLVLDEVHRFPNSFVDSLLSLLEDGSINYEGRTVYVPVSICMAMSPPGHDYVMGNYQALSSRVARRFRITFPDLGTLSYHILLPAIEEMRISFLNRLQQSIDKMGRARSTRFPSCPIEHVHKISLITIMCCGDGSERNLITPYLGESNLALIREALSADAIARSLVGELSSLCMCDPDCRTSVQWAKIAIGLTLDDATRSSEPQLRLNLEDLQKTVVQAFSHRLRDQFSPAQSPELTQRKELVLYNLCDRVLTNAYYDGLVRSFSSDDF